MRTPLYRACVALLDLCEDPAQRAASWRALSALRLHPDDVAEVARRLDVDCTGDDRRAKAWTTWVAVQDACAALTAAFEDASNEPGSAEPLCVSPPLAAGRPAPGFLRLVLGSHRGRQGT